MAFDLDDLDTRILQRLLADGRTPAAQIAEEIGLSRPAVADRIEKLERNGVIRGTTVVLSPDSLGRRVTAFVSARGPKLTSRGWSAFRELMSSEEVLEVHTVAGDDCFLIKLRTDSLTSLYQLVERICEAPISLATRTTIVLETHIEKVGGVSLGGEVTQ